MHQNVYGTPISITGLHILLPTKAFTAQQSFLVYIWSESDPLPIKLILINDLLQYSRTSRTEKTLHKVDLNEIILNSKLELSQNIEDKKAQIILSQKQFVYPP